MVENVEPAPVTAMVEAVVFVKCAGDRRIAAGLHGERRAGVEREQCRSRCA